MKQMQKNHHQLKHSVKLSVQRMKKAIDDRPTVYAQTVYLGTLGLVFVLPVVAGAYLGRWLDSRLPGYSVSWPITLILLGVFVGAVDVYLLLKESEYGRPRVTERHPGEAWPVRDYRKRRHDLDCHAGPCPGGVAANAKNTVRAHPRPVPFGRGCYRDAGRNRRRAASARGTSFSICGHAMGLHSRGQSHGLDSRASLTHRRSVSDLQSGGSGVRLRLLVWDPRGRVRELSPPLLAAQPDHAPVSPGKRSVAHGGIGGASVWKHDEFGSGSFFGGLDRRFARTHTPAPATHYRSDHPGLFVRNARVDLYRRRNSITGSEKAKGKRGEFTMKEMNWFVTLSTLICAIGIVLGTMLPALAMGRAISRALDALARQPEAEKSISRTLFIGLAMIESLAIYCLVIILIILFRNPLISYLTKP